MLEGVEDDILAKFDSSSVVSPILRSQLGDGRILSECKLAQNYRIKKILACFGQESSIKLNLQTNTNIKTSAS
jgi:hypothetical protein